MGDLGWAIWLVEHKGQITQAIGEITAGCIALCSLASAVLPPAAKPGFYANARKIINTVGANVGHARNAN